VTNSCTPSVLRRKISVFFCRIAGSLQVPDSFLIDFEASFPTEVLIRSWASISFHSKYAIIYGFWNLSWSWFVSTRNCTLQVHWDLKGTEAILVWRAIESGFWVSSTGRASRERERLRKMSNRAEGAAELQKDGEEIQPLLTPYQLGPLHLSHR